jgi:hypothetical protein
MDVWKEEGSSITHATFRFMRGRCDTIVESSCASRLYLLCIITRSSWPNSFVKCSGSKITSLSADVHRGHLLPGYKLLDRSELRTWLETSFIWIIEQDEYTMTQVRSWQHGTKVAWHHVGYLLNISDARALTGHNDHAKALVKSQLYDSMIGANQGVHLGKSEWYATLLKKVKQGFDTTRKSIWPTILEK